MRLHRSLIVGTLLLAQLASAQESLFGSGKPPVFREEDKDRRFTKSKVARALSQGSEDPGCVQGTRDATRPRSTGTPRTGGASR